MRTKSVAKKAAFSNPEETLWSTQLRKAMDWRKAYTQETKWPGIDRIYMHQYNDDLPHFNLIFIMAQTLLPNLVYQAPGIINTPNRPGMVQWASLWDSVDNWWINHAEIKSIAQEAVLQSYLHNIAHGFIGFDFDNKIVKDMREVEGAVDRTRKTNAPWVDLVPSHRVLFAPGTKQMRNCPWVAKFVSTPTKVLKGQKGLSNVFSSAIPNDIKFHEEDLWQFRDSTKYTCFWQIHDAETKKWAWLSTTGKFIMNWEDDPYQVDGLPCESLVLNKNTRSIWGTSDPIYIMSQHKEGDDTRLQGLKQKRLAVPKFLYDSQAIDEETLTRILSAASPAGIPVDLPGDKKMVDVIKELNTSPNFGLMEYTKYLMNDAQHITGSGNNQMGNYAPGRRSATEANIVEGVSSSRTGSKRAEVGGFIERLTRKANKLCASNWTGDIVQQVLGYDGVLYWVNADPKKLEETGFGVTTTVNIESLAPVSRERRKKEAADLLNMLSVMTEAGANPLPILKQFLTQFEWVDVSQVLPQSNEPMGMDDFISQQEGMLANGGMGPTSVNNMQGVQSLIQRLPAEQTTGDNNGSETNG